MDKPVVYALCESTGAVRYVGKTFNLARRLKEHTARVGKRKTHLYNWLGKAVAAGGFKHVVLETASGNEDLNKKEIRWIADLRHLGFDLVNATVGGDGAIGYKHSAEAKARIAAARLGRKGPPMPEHIKLFLSAKYKGKKMNLLPEARERISASKRGVPRSEETRRKISAAQNPRWIQDEAGNIYKSRREAELALGLSQPTVAKALNGGTIRYHTLTYVDSSNG